MLQRELPGLLARWRPRLRAGGSTYSALPSTPVSAGQERPSSFCTATGSRAPTCSRSRNRSPRPSMCLHRTCPVSGEVSNHARRSVSRISPPRSPGGWTRPGSAVRCSLRTRWAVRSSRSSPCTGRSAWGRWCLSARRSIRSGAPHAISCSAGCVTQRGNRGRCSRSPHTMTLLSALVRYSRPPARPSATGSSSDCRRSRSRRLSCAARTMRS